MKNTITSGKEVSLSTNWLNTIRVVSPALSKKIPIPRVMLTGRSPYRLDRDICDVGKLSSASANHCCSLPYRHKRNSEARIAASVIVNQAP